jgi:acetyltransferase-like isoleucine patch superfamily enzyme
VSASVHPTALVEEGVELGDGTAVWDHVHIRGPAKIGASSIVGGKTYVAYGVEIGDKVKINAQVYIPTGVTIETGVMISAGVIFTNDLYPRATTTDLRSLRSSGVDEHTRRTLVREGATIGAGSVVGCDLVIGRFAMVGMGAIVTRPVPDFYLVVGSPAKPISIVCRCGQPILRLEDGIVDDHDLLTCGACGLRYATQKGVVIEHDPPS